MENSKFSAAVTVLLDLNSGLNKFIPVVVDCLTEEEITQEIKNMYEPQWRNQL